MSSAPPTTAPRPAPRKKSDVEYVEYDTYINRQVERTRRAVKLVDLSNAVLVLVIGLLGFLLTAAVIEHWVVPGGLGAWGRLLMFTVMLGCGGYYVARYLWPLLSRPINPAYAAEAIEREHPTLKNSLLNFLLFRTQKKQMPSAVFEALEEQAARRLSQTAVDDSVDRSALVKLGYVLLAVVTLAIVYAVLSPKSSLTTAARVLMPWANIAAPSRVRIDHVEPGNVEVVQGETLEVSALVAGLREGEQVQLSYDTVDGHRVDQRITMHPADDAGKYACTLPSDDDAYAMAAIDQDLRYRIVAGDGRTIDYDIRVLTAPTIRVRSVHYDFPEYTGYVDRTIDDRGDVRAIEGTKVTLHATANTDIESAFVDLAADGKNDLRMRVDGHEAQAGIELQLDDRRQTTKTSSYMLRYTSAEGLANSDPPQHVIEITPDYAPEVELLEPEELERDVRVNETVEMKVDARDPDFALRTVAIRIAKQDGSTVTDQLLLSGRHEGKFVGKWQFTPFEYNLQPGDVVDVWAEATDIRAPQANRSTSERKQLRIVGDPDQQNRQQRGDGQQGEPQPQQGGQGEGQQQQDQGEGQQGQGADGEGQDGNEGQGQQGEGQGEQGSDTGQGQAEGNQGGEGQQQGGQSGDQQGDAQNQQGEGMQGGQQHGGEQSGAGQQDGEGQAGGNQSTHGQSPDQQDQNRQGGEGGRPQQGQQGGENTKPVANDGSDDSEAFERIQRRLTDEERQQATRQQRDGQSGNQGDSGEADEAESSDNRDQDGQQQANRDAQRQEGNSTKSPDGQQGTAAERQDQGDGADTNADAPQSEGDRQDGTKPDGTSQSTGGDERNSRGEQGAGNETNPQGGPDAQEELKQRQKRNGAGDQESQSDETEPPTPGHSKHESDSRGEQGGDRAGGGEEGGGQQAPREGTGSSGQNQAADEGAGQSADQGPGEDGQRGGDATKADGQTGESGDEAGDGTQQRDGEGQQRGGQPGEEQTGGREQQPGAESDGGEQQRGGEQSDADEQSDAGQPGQQQRGEGQSNRNQANRNQTPSGDPQSQSGDSPGPNSGTPGMGQDSGNNKVDAPLAGADDANLEYARKQTDLVLEELSQQLDDNQVDQKMLDDLGWSEEDLRRFVDRWNQLRAAAERPGATDAQQELDARLRNLGESLGPKDGATRRTQDDFRDLREGYQNKVPLKYRDRLKAYTEGVSRARGE